jgi:lysophospholipase L1-like esterase
LGAALVLAPPAALLCDSAIAAVQGWRPEGTIEHGALFGAGAWLLIALIFLARPGVRKLVGMLGLNMLVLAIAATVAWGMLEAGAAWTSARLSAEAAFHTRGPSLNQLFQPAPAHITGIEGASRYATGEDGIRAPFSPAPRHTRRVLCVGGSTTECTYLDDYETWPALVMNFINDDRSDDQVWVGNVGISGFSTREHLLFVRTSPLLDGMHAIIVQAGINDLWRFLAGESLRIDYARFAPEQARAAESTQLPLPRRPLWTRSRVIQLYHDLLRIRAHQDKTDPVSIEGDAGEEYGLRRERRAKAEITEELPALDRGRRRFAMNIEAIAMAAKERGLEVLFTTQPVLWAKGLEPDIAERAWFGWLDDKRYLSLEALRQGMDAYNATLRDTCAKIGVPCVDLSALHGDPDYFYDDCHFTEAGAEAVAERVAPGLIRLLGLTPADAQAARGTANP